jgi:membrane associated rhomboid family serine protease
MALADRDYQREEYHPPRYTTKLIVVLIVAFVLQSAFHIHVTHRKVDPMKALVGQEDSGFDSFKWLGLSGDGLKHGYVWQLVTFQFMHAVPAPWHVLFNCLGIFFFGRPVEERLGGRKYLSLYFLSGVAGGLLYALMAIFVFPSRSGIPVVGASAGLYGVMAIFCMLNPMQTIMIYVFPVRAIYFFWFLAALSLYGTIVPFDSSAHAAHLGGVLVGIAYVRWFHESDRFSQWLAGLRRRRPSRPVVKVRFPKAVGGDSKTPGVVPRELGPTDFISKEVDPILEKISAQGLHSLTEREKKILEAARAKIEKH